MTQGHKNQPLPPGAAPTPGASTVPFSGAWGSVSPSCQQEHSFLAGQLDEVINHYQLLRRPPRCYHHRQPHCGDD